MIMKSKQIITAVLVFFAVFSSVYAKKSKKAGNSTKFKIVASTSWTAAFADLAGADSVEAIAPVSLRHPPEYEVTVSDIQKIASSKIFIYAGFERMMKTLGDSVENVKMMRIHCNNSIENVTAESMKIAEILGTQKKCEKRVAEYKNAILDAKKQLEKSGLADAKVFCNVNQIYLAKDLGFEIAETFGPGQVTSEQIIKASKEKYAFIIDNVHNPVGKPLAEVSPDSRYIVWRNFPERIEPNALLNVVVENIKALK